MPEGRRVVFDQDVNLDRLPEWSNEGAIVIEWLQQNGMWQESGERLQLQREGGYCGQDALLFLLYFFASGLPIGFKNFAERSRPYKSRLAAVGGRKLLPSASAMSRLLSAVRPGDLRSFGEWLLLDAPDMAGVLQHPSVLTRDAEGNGWHIFDWDPTVTTLRHRALPVGEGLPKACRRSAKMAQPGYGGRKRGDVQFSRATLQHAGSGLWIGTELAPGNGHVRESFLAALGTIKTACEKGGVSANNAVIRSDGIAGNVPFITACQEANIHYITRLTRNGLLEHEEVIKRLDEANWYEVPDSGSGPRRQATELGIFVLEPDERSYRGDGSLYMPIESRVVASRFASKEKRGAGVIIDGWHYELYATDLVCSAWPSFHLVTGYYGRSGQENRFAQEDREFGLDRIFSYSLPGQELATLVALFVWNFHICRGLELANPPRELPEQKRIVPVPIEQAVKTEESTTIEPSEATQKASPSTIMSNALDPPDEKSMSLQAELNKPDVLAPATKDDGSRQPLVSKQMLATALEKLPWSVMLADKPDWSWNGDFLGLDCPAGNTITFKRVETTGDKRQRLRFLAAWGLCDTCPLRETCLSSADPTYRKDIRLLVPPAHGGHLQELWVAYKRQHRAKRGRPLKKGHAMAWRRGRPAKHAKWSPPPEFLPGSTYLSLAPPLLLPAQLRKESRSISVSTEITVSVTPFHALPKPQSLAFSASERQRRRLTWEQRRRWNALPDEAQVTIRIARVAGPIPIFRDSTCVHARQAKMQRSAG
jgi:hypothetical protein